MHEGRSAHSCLGSTSDTAVGRRGGEGNGARKADSPAEAGDLSESLTDDSPGYALSGTARGSVTVAAWTLISRITGLLRVVVIGAVLGPTFFANAFLSANSVPNLIYTALAGPVLALVLVPALVHSLAERGVAASGQLLSKVTGYLLFWASVTAGAVVLASPLVALAVTAGIPDDATRWRAWQLTIVIVVFVAPQVICYTLAAVGAAAQQARGRFALASAAPDGYRLVGLCGAVLLADLVAALMTLFMIRTAIRPERLLDPRRLAIVGAATVAMLPASTFGFWLVQHQVHDRLPQLAVGFAMGVVALACFGLVLALLTGQRATVIAKVRARLRA